MKPLFAVQILDFRIVEEIEGAFSSGDFAELLRMMDFEETASMTEAETREMALLALQDLQPEAAAELVLTQHLKERLSVGQIRNAANEMLDEKLWEHHADLSLHEGMFNVASVLYAAFPTVFPQPDAVHVRLEVSSDSNEGREVLAQPLHESFLVRLLADGMDDTAVLRRVFEEQLVGRSFPEADEIVWIVEVEAKPTTTTIEVTSSGYWLDPLRGAKSYESTAYADR